jgi:hypothetical protein
VLRFGGRSGDGESRFVRKEGSPFTFLVSSQLDRILTVSGYTLVEDKTGESGGAESRVFEGPPIGPDLIRNTMRAGAVLLARADESAVRSDGSLAVEPPDDALWSEVPFRVEEVLYGDVPVEEDGTVSVELPVRRKLPNLSPEGNAYLLFLEFVDGSLRLQGEPIESLFQPDLEKLKYVRQILDQKKRGDAIQKERAKEREEGQR